MQGAPRRGAAWPLDGAGSAPASRALTAPHRASRTAWHHLEAQTREAIERYLAAAAAAGASLEEAELPASFERLLGAQQTIHCAETAYALGHEADRHGDAVSSQLRAHIAAGRAVTRETYLAARRLADEQRWRWHERFSSFDAVLAPSALGVPPAGLDHMGDPLLCRPFTLLGVPALALPGAWTPDGLPVGLQLAGVLHGDRGVLAVARWLLARV